MTKGKYIRTEEHKKRMSDIMMGDKHPWYGKHHSQTTKLKVSGKNHYNWKGGKKPRISRSHAKRKGLGHNLINELISDDMVAHHLTTDYVAYIPEFINKSISHNIHTGKNMDEVNFYTLNYLFLVYNKEN